MRTVKAHVSLVTGEGAVANGDHTLDLCDHLRARLNKDEHLASTDVRVDTSTGALRITVTVALPFGAHINHAKVLALAWVAAALGGPTPGLPPEALAALSVTASGWLI